jgi:hypothetical protein
VAEKAAGPRRSSRTSAGQLNKNVALHADPEVERLGRRIRIGFAIAGIVMLALLSLLIWLASSRKYDAKTAEALTRARLQRYQALAVRLPSLKPGEKLDERKMTDAFKNILRENLESLKREADAARNEGGRTGRKLAEAYADAEGDVSMKDFWNRGIEIAFDPSQDVIKFISRGADGKKGTADDLIACSRIGRMGEAGIAREEENPPSPSSPAEMYPPATDMGAPPPPRDAVSGKSAETAPAPPPEQPITPEPPPPGEWVKPKGVPPPPPPPKKTDDDKPKPSTEAIF